MCKYLLYKHVEHYGGYGIQISFHLFQVYMFILDTITIVRETAVYS